MMKAKALALVAFLSRNSDAAIAGSSLRGLSSDEILPPVLDSAATSFEEMIHMLNVTKGENMTKPEGKGPHIKPGGKGENMTKPEVPPTPHPAPEACDTTEGKLYEHITETLTMPGYVDLETELKKINYLNLRINQFMDKIEACNITDDESLEALGELIDFKDILEVEEQVPDCELRKAMKMFQKERDCLAMDSANVNSEIKKFLSSTTYKYLETERQDVCYIFRGIQRFKMVIEACEMTGEDMSNSLEELQTHVDVLAAGEGMVESDCASHCPESEVDEETDKKKGPGKGPGGKGPGKGPGPGTGFGMAPSVAPSMGLEMGLGNFEGGTEEQGLLALKNSHDEVSDLMGKLNDIYDAVAEKFGAP